MSAIDVYLEAMRRGLHLEPREGGMLAIMPPDRCPPEFVAVLRQHKRELLDLLEAKANHLPADCAPWLHIARQVTEGEFDGADRSTVESISIGLRSIPHPLCRRALARLLTHSAA